MLGFAIIFGVTLAGYAGTGIWVIVAGVVGLASLSYSSRQRLHERAAELGLTAIADRTLIASLGNALAATLLGYLGGVGFAALA